MTITATVEAELPKDAAVGDEYEIRGTVRVTGISEGLIDVTRIGDEPGSRHAPGYRDVELLIRVDGYWLRRVTR